MTKWLIAVLISIVTSGIMAFGVVSTVAAQQSGQELGGQMFSAVVLPS